MSKLKLKIKLNTEFEVDLNDFDFQGLDENQIKTELLQNYFDEIGIGEIEIEQKNKQSIKIAVSGNQYDRAVCFHEVELDRELTQKEKSKIASWIGNGQNGKLILENEV